MLTDSVRRPSQRFVLFGWRSESAGGAPNKVAATPAKTHLQLLEHSALSLRSPNTVQTSRVGMLSHGEGEEKEEVPGH